MKKILFVCTGNICRSPTAEGIARAHAEKHGRAGDFHFDSAGTESYHIGQAPDRRSAERARRRGYDLSALRARRVRRADFDEFDLILAMDRSHFEQLEDICPDQHRHKIKLFLSYAGDDGFGLDVPDPYYGTDPDFDRVIDLCEKTIENLVR